MSDCRPGELIDDIDDISEEYSDREEEEIRARLKRNYKEAARRRAMRLELFTPVSRESRSQMELRLARIRDARIARMSLCKDTRRVGVAWIEPSLLNFAGVAAKGLVLLREDADLRAGTTTGVIPFAGISQHALRRFASRSNVGDLDEVMRAAAGGLGWNHVVSHLDIEGEYFVPHADGLFCNVALRDGIRDLSDPTGKLHHATLMKTWFSTEILRSPLTFVRERLLMATRSKVPFFPGFNDIHDWHLPAFYRMRDEGRERERIRLNGYGRPNDERYAYWRPSEKSMETRRLAA